MGESIRLGRKSVGDDCAAFIVAEAGVNHNGDVQLGHRLIEAARDAGVDAVKFQSFFSEDIVTPGAIKADYQFETTGSGGHQLEMLKSLELKIEEHEELKDHCEEAGLLYLCTPYETRSVENLEKIGVHAYKIASTDANNLPFLQFLARKGKPMILSTGMSTMEEIEEAVEVISREGMRDRLILLHCTSEYPAPYRDLNLRAIRSLKSAFHCVVGFSDHTPGIGASPWAVALGAKLIEKHFTLDRKLEGPDHRASIEPQELKELTCTIRNLEAALGDGQKRVMPSEEKNKVRMQKSIVASRKIHPGEKISPENVTCKRPGDGLPPHLYFDLIGKEVLKDIGKDELIRKEHLKWD